MAVVDAAVGIKTAVKFHEKKNKLGTYCPPLAVFYDLAFLQTLQQRHVSNGAAEILKMACIKDRELFDLLEAHAADLVANSFKGEVGSRVIRRSIQAMLEELEHNLWEAILVRLVDYGHTISPELEMAALRGPSMLLHGEAVAIDMVLSTELAFGRGMLTAEERLRVLELMMALKLPLWHEKCSVELCMKGLDDMTRARDGLQRVPLMQGLGAATFVNDITKPEVAVAANRLLQFAADHAHPAVVTALQPCMPQHNSAITANRVGAGAAVTNNAVPLPPSLTSSAVAVYQGQTKHTLQAAPVSSKQTTDS